MEKAKGCVLNPLHPGGECFRGINKLHASLCPHVVCSIHAGIVLLVAIPSKYPAPHRGAGVSKLS